MFRTDSTITNRSLLRFKPCEVIVEQKKKPLDKYASKTKFFIALLLLLLGYGLVCVSQCTQIDLNGWLKISTFDATKTNINSSYRNNLDLDEKEERIKTHQKNVLKKIIQHQQKLQQQEEIERLSQLLRQQKKNEEISQQLQKIDTERGQQPENQQLRYEHLEKELPIQQLHYQQQLQLNRMLEEQKKANYEIDIDLQRQEQMIIQQQQLEQLTKQFLEQPPPGDYLKSDPIRNKSDF